MSDTDNTPELLTEAAPFDGAAFVRTLGSAPGVYRMYDKGGRILYVGKARNLKARVASYFRDKVDSPKTRVLVSKIARVEVTITENEKDALLLEQTLIKKDRPPYNIIYRDDKSYPYIYLSSHQVFPGVRFYRGARPKKGKCYGPYPNSFAVREALHFVQKVFQVRDCKDSQFHNRSRPCLQHQIGRCTAPCVGLVDEQGYAKQVELLDLFLSGQETTVIKALQEQMQAAADALDFEKAALIRDQLGALQDIRAGQGVEHGNAHVDIWAYVQRPAGTAVCVMVVRGGKVIDSRNFIPAANALAEEADVLETYMEQYYLQEPVYGYPSQIVLKERNEFSDSLLEVVRERAGTKSLNLVSRAQGIRKTWLRMAEATAGQYLESQIASRSTASARVDDLAQQLGLSTKLQRLECFDISHTQGEGTVGSCVVFDRDGPRKADYRRFNIREAAASDDYAAIREAFSRRYQRLVKEQVPLPDVILLDGGQGQVSAVTPLLAELGIEPGRVFGVSKGVDRRAGQEVLHRTDGSQFVLQERSPGLMLVQHIRDEAHRFALAGHRAKRKKVREASRLDAIPGIGPKRRKALLLHFGGLPQLSNASAAEIARVEGVSDALAAEIYAALH